jgi:hypothetical protein
MIFVTFSQLREHVDMDKFNHDLVMEVFEYLRAGDKNHFLFSNTDEYKEKCPEYAISQGWDSETTLVLFEPPPTEEEKAIQQEKIAKQIAEDPDWDDIQIGQVDPKQVVCSFYPNLTFEKLVQTFNSFGNMKAFL